MCGGRLMQRIKIISNPYKKETSYQKWSSEDEAWVSIDYENNRNSKLLNHELTGGFFPFRAKTIVDLLIEEYGADEEKIELFFEGSADEYQELEAVCQDTVYNGYVIPYRSDIYLENARDILPEVRSLFQEMSPLIVQSVSQDKIQRDLSRFTDASSDVVPICVLGNYSAGKSTFINALIGSEILPSGIEPVTAKIYKISRSKYPDRAYVKCQFLGYDVFVQFTNSETKFPTGMIENPLSSLLKDELADMDGESLVVRVNKVLSVINDYENNAETSEISDLIEVDIPFINGVLAKSQHPFIIFDTPGSNSASNARHLQVLKQAMANMTNGLPIFLSTPDSLDSTDNENLYHIIRDMDELDNRFTMIVVNKADGPGLQRKESSASEQKRILAQAVPRNLYSGGLFYVSSILGLGAKNDGDFLDDFYAETFEDQVYKYSNPKERRYKTLYSFNIMPSQIKRRADDLAAAQEDLVYANSGLFSVETEIETFAGKYSAYNKCFQSQMFLNRVIQVTGEEIADQKVECEGIRQSIKDKLEVDKKNLIDRIEASADEQRTAFVNGYSDYMAEYVASADDTFSVEDLKQQEQSYTSEQETAMDFGGRSDDVKKSQESLAENLKTNIMNAFKQRNVASIKEIASGFQADYESARESRQMQKETRHLVDKQAADMLLKHVTEKYEARLAEVYSLLDRKSQEYWTAKTEELRTVLARIVAGSDVLTESRRQELERIIIMYQQITFNENSAETIFDKVNFERRIKIGDQVIWQSDHLNIDKLAKTYNTNISRGVHTRYGSVEESHRESAYNWIQSLLDEIYSNIVEYSPELSKQAKQIKIMTSHIDELEGRQMRLKQYTEELQQMMDWKTV